MHLLVMTESWQGALACIQSFGRKGHTVSVIADTHRSIHCQSKFVKNVVSLPYDPDLNRYSAHLIDLTRQLGADLVVPISDTDAHVVALAKEISPANRAFLSPSLNSVELVRSRNATTTLCSQLDIVTPPTVCITNATNVAEAAKKLGFPLFLKLSGTVGSQGVHLISSLNELQIILDRLSDTSELQLQRPIVGDFVDITGFAADGILMESFAFKTHYRFSRNGGEIPYVTRLKNPQQLAFMLSKIVSALNWSGGIDIDCLQTETGDVFLLEINPRFSGMITFPLKLGMDLPSFYLSTFTGEKCEGYVPTKKSNANAFIHLLSEVRYVSGKPRERLIEAIEFRRKNSWVDSMFWDDRPLTRALMRQELGGAWQHLKKIAGAAGRLRKHRSD